MLPDPFLLSTQPGHDLRQFLNEKGYSRVLVLLDENTHKHCYPLIKNALPSHTTYSIPSGESVKTLQTCEQIWSAMTDALLDRHSVLLIIGGGVLGDMGGFCAATYKRGIDFILIPTTLLAMADASIGGKLGIDFKGFKNHIGVFCEPVKTIIHTDFLKTLPEAELRSGFAEIIKHALISDKAVWKELQKHDIEVQPWDTLIAHSARFKSEITRKDPIEKGLRKTLNAGHTIGHAIESYFLDQDKPILHGEAVAAGLVCETFIASKLDMVQEAERKEVTRYILSVFGKLNVEQHEIESIARWCIQDKKNKGNSIQAALLDGIGKARWDVKIKIGQIAEALTFYRLLQI